MNVTTIFRDFLINNKVKQKFESEWKKKHPHGPKLTWGDDFLTNYMVYTLHRSEESECWKFLNPRAVFDWDYSADGFDFWDGINEKWKKHYKEVTHG